MIKNFIYLNESKLYSFSSQLFKGVTEFVLNESTLDNSHEQNSKDGLTSSRVIADVIRETSKSTEKRFLHDHSFNLFERQLEDENKILEVNHFVDSEHLLETLNDYSFVRIKAKILISDVNEIVSLLRNFNEIGEKLEVSQMQTQLEIIEAKHVSSNNKNKEKAIEAEFAKAYNIQKQALDKGLRQPKIWSSALTDMIELNAKNALQFQQKVADIICSSYIEEEHLRENLTSIKRKYSRLTESEFTVLGLICQRPGTENKSEIDIAQTEDGVNAMKTRLRALAASMLGIEEFSYGKEDNELILEPIAIYSEL
jgi:hypothetical protein